MKARQLIGSSIYGPRALQVVFQAFDGAWDDMAGRFGDDQRAIERVQKRLAHAILMVATEDSDDVERLKKDALRLIMAADE